MSRFFATGSDSESVSSESDEEIVQKPVVATKWVCFSYSFVMLMYSDGDMGAVEVSKVQDSLTLFGHVACVYGKAEANHWSNGENPWALQLWFTSLKNINNTLTSFDLELRGARDALSSSNKGANSVIKQYRTAV